MRQALRTLATGLLALVTCAAANAKDSRVYTDDRDEQAVDRVWTYLDAKDCRGAVAELNRGLAGRHRAVRLLAGAMFEEGVCVKRDWDRAVGFYQEAHAAGHAAAAARLASGYARPTGGPDAAAALWWGLKGEVLEKTHECTSVSPLLDDPDRFVQALRAWPAARLQACVHVVGVLSSLRSEIEYPQRSRMLGLEAELGLVFLPAEGRITVTTRDVKLLELTGLVAGAVEDTRHTRRVQRDFEQSMQEAADRALKRHPRPDGVPADWKIGLTLRFNLVP